MERLTERELYNGKVCFTKCEKMECKDKCSCCDVPKEVIKKLKKYEDLEEQGLLLKLPCSIGSDVYFIPSKVVFELNRINGEEERNRVCHQKVVKIVFTERGWYMECDKDLEYGTGNILLDKFYKETWFLTQNEAEEALKEMEE